MQPSSENDRLLQKEFNAQLKRGTHAVEGAQAILPVVSALTNRNTQWCAVVLSAIMHHHTPDASECKAFHMIPAGQDAIRRALELSDLALEAHDIPAQIVTRFEQSSATLGKLANKIKPSATKYMTTHLYALFVRVLRLADQRSGHYWRQYGSMHNKE